MKNYVWYACYGSNLNEGRFKYYIRGGVYPENNSEYKGCRDKTDFIDKSITTINYGLYFAEKSKAWENKSVAFLTSKAKNSYTTKCVLYKITPEQFIDVFLQENGKTSNASSLTPEILKDLKPTEEKMIGDKNDNKWYGRLIRLQQDKEGCPVYTFTSKIPDSEIVSAEPVKNILKL